MNPSPVSTLRTRVLKLRKSLLPETLRALSHSVAQTALESHFGRALLTAKPLKIAVYRAMPGEVDLAQVATALFEAGHHLHYPRMSGEDTLEMVEFSPTGKFIEGKYGIGEPPAGKPVVAPEKLDLIFVPGVVFGRRGERIGMGKGYYDRYLARAPQAYRVALAAQFQVKDRVPQNPWDIRLDLVFTQRRGYLAPRARPRSF